MKTYEFYKKVYTNRVKSFNRLLQDSSVEKQIIFKEVSPNYNFIRHIEFSSDCKITFTNSKISTCRFDYENKEVFESEFFCKFLLFLQTAKPNSHYEFSIVVRQKDKHKLCTIDFVPIAITYKDNHCTFNYDAATYLEHSKNSTRKDD